MRARRTNQFRHPEQRLFVSPAKWHALYLGAFAVQALFSKRQECIAEDHVLEERGRYREQRHFGRAERRHVLFLDVFAVQALFSKHRVTVQQERVNFAGRVAVKEEVVGVGLWADSSGSMTRRAGGLQVAMYETARREGILEWRTAYHGWARTDGQEKKMIRQ